MPNEIIHKSDNFLMVEYHCSFCLFMVGVGVMVGLYHLEIYCHWKLGTKLITLLLIYYNASLNDNICYALLVRMMLVLKIVTWKVTILQQLLHWVISFWRALSATYLLHWRSVVLTEIRLKTRIFRVLPRVLFVRLQNSTILMKMPLNLESLVSFWAARLFKIR